jgi:hypothetical protein
MVNLGGDDSTVVYRDRSRPIVFPELPILQFMHGEEAITDVHVVGSWEATNDEVLQRLLSIYGPETVQAVFPGNRPRLPASDASVPHCTLPIYTPRPTRPDSPDPKLRPLDQFTITKDMPVLEAPPLPAESVPTPDEIAAHAQDDDDDDLGLSDPQMPRVEDLPHIVRDTLGRGSGGVKSPASRHAATLPDVNAGGSHSPTYVPLSTRK